MIIRNNKNLVRNAGFSLMEVMLSVAILSLGIVASFSLISSSMAKFSSATNKIIASNLAQDGIERVRQVRDTNWLQNRTKPDDDSGNACSQDNWDCDIEGRSNASGKQFVKFSCVNGSIDEAINASNMLNDTIPTNTEKMQIDYCSDPDGNNNCKVYKYYNGTSWSSADSTRKCIADDMGSESGYNEEVYSNFYRLIHIKRLNDYFNKVMVTIKWFDRTGTHYFTAEEILYNWKETGP